MTLLKLQLIGKTCHPSLRLFKKISSKLAYQITVPVILDGGNRDYDEMFNILNTTEIEYFSLAHPFIAESGLVKRWEDGDTRIAKCVS